jgi:hypothetical protein
MNWLHSYAQRHIPSLLSGLLLYWEGVTSICCEVTASYGALYGSSLYDPTNALCMSAPLPKYGDAGSLQQPSEDYREWRDRMGLLP